MIRVFARNENGKIELTVEELQKLLEEAKNEEKLLNSVKEPPPREKFDREFNQGVLFGELQFLKAKRG